MGLGQVLSMFECLVFRVLRLDFKCLGCRVRVRVSQVWSDFWNITSSVFV